eukprot:356047-Chlamydomonas_euryale.AAC.1
MGTPATWSLPSTRSLLTSWSSLPPAVLGALLQHADQGAWVPGTRYLAWVVNAFEPASQGRHCDMLIKLPAMSASVGRHGLHCDMLVYKPALSAWVTQTTQLLNAARFTRLGLV